MTPFEALKEADKRGFDLVEISPKAVPPVCKIMDFGKFKYEQKKKTQGQKKQAAASIVKEITLSPQTDQHDLDFKMKNSIGFLGEGNRVKVTIRFRGREMAHPEIGRKQMEKVIESLKAHGTPEGNPKMEGKLLIGIFTPIGHGPTPVAKPKISTAAQKAPVKAPPKPMNPPVIAQKRGPVVETTGGPKPGATTA